MSVDLREYLIERFRTDATTLRQRAAAIAGAAKPAPGPDAALSRAMADACDDVATLAEQLPSRATVEEIVAALRALLPELMTRAHNTQSQKAPAIKSVYIGASTRVQELIAAELQASADSAGPEHNTEFDEDDE